MNVSFLVGILQHHHGLGDVVLLQLISRARCHGASTYFDCVGHRCVLLCHQIQHQTDIQHLESKLDKQLPGVGDITLSQLGLHYYLPSGWTSQPFEPRILLCTYGSIDAAAKRNPSINLSSTLYVPKSTCTTLTRLTRKLHCCLTDVNSYQNETHAILF